MPNYYKYWGKAMPSSDGDSARFHLLCYHSLDVAAVGYQLLDQDPMLCCRLAADLNVSNSWLRDIFTFCLMLHDIGKFTRAFQNLVPNLSPELVAFDGRCAGSIRHDSLGFSLWNTIGIQRIFSDLTDQQRENLTVMIEIVCGHHGKPPENIRRAIRSYLLPEDEQAVANFVEDAKSLWLPDLVPLANIDINNLKRVSWQLAGAAVMADWLGSNQTIFSYIDKIMPLDEYWSSIALPRAERALALSISNNLSVNPFTSIKQQFEFIKQPTPLQSFAENVQIGDSQQLFILEDVTGAGKTEAAMVLVHRLMSLGLAKGVYVGLPTMATANGMYSRMAQSYRSLYAGEQAPSLVLAHGASNLSEQFSQSTRFSDKVALIQQQEDKDYARDDVSASAYCNQWLADNRKKSLLADVGVGTIDQALLGILPARHQSLRLLGLTNKVLLVDEVHAFDPYMRTLLAALVRAHAAQGGSVILLSATLPFNLRSQLINAFALGAGINCPRLSLDAKYPWVTQFSHSGFVESPVDTRDSVRRRVKVTRIETKADCIKTIREVVNRGACVCWIRNTVKDAQAIVAIIARENAPYSLNELQHALRSPKFHLYLGRKSCPLAAPLDAQIIAANGFREALDAYDAKPLLTNTPNWNSDSRWLPDDELTRYHWEGNIEMFSPYDATFVAQQVQTFSRHDLPASRQRWQFLPRQEYLWMQQKEAS